MLNERWGRFLRINLSDIPFVKKCWHVDGFGLFLKLVNYNKIMTNNKCHLYLKIRASCPLFSIFLAEFFLFLNRGPEAGRCHVSYRLWSPLRQSCDFGQCQIKAKKKSWACVSGPVSVGLFFFLHLSGHVLASTQQQTHGIHVKQCAMGRGRTKDVCEFKGDTKFNVFSSSCSFLISLSPTATHCSTTLPCLPLFSGWTLYELN